MHELAMRARHRESASLANCQLKLVFLDFQTHAPVAKIVRVDADGVLHSDRMPGPARRLYYTVHLDSNFGVWSVSIATGGTTRLPAGIRLQTPQRPPKYIQHVLDAGGAIVFGDQPCPIGFTYVTYPGGGTCDTPAEPAPAPAEPAPTPAPPFVSTTTLTILLFAATWFMSVCLG